MGEFQSVECSIHIIHPSEAIFVSQQGERHVLRTMVSYSGYSLVTDDDIMLRKSRGVGGLYYYGGRGRESRPGPVNEVGKERGAVCSEEATSHSQPVDGPRDERSHDM